MKKKNGNLYEYINLIGSGSVAVQWLDSGFVAVNLWFP